MTTMLTKPITEAEAETAPREYHWTVDTYHRVGDAGVFDPDVKLELLRGRIIDRYAEGGPTGYHWTADTLFKAINAGVFENPERLELLHGRIMDRMPQGSVHLSRRARIARRLRLAVEPLYYVMEECSIQIAFDGVPVPDVAVLRGGEGDYDDSLPTAEDALLLVEIAVSSVANDLGEKALLYAQAGITDYWVALPEVGEIMVHREPSAEGYGSVTRLNEMDTLTPLAAPDVTLAVRDLLGASG